MRRNWNFTARPLRLSISRVDRPRRPSEAAARDCDAVVSAPRKAKTQIRARGGLHRRFALSAPIEAEAGRQPDEADPESDIGDVGERAGVGIGGVALGGAPAVRPHQR